MLYSTLCYVCQVIGATLPESYPSAKLALNNPKPDKRSRPKSKRVDSKVSRCYFFESGRVDWQPTDGTGADAREEVRIGI